MTGTVKESIHEKREAARSRRAKVADALCANCGGRLFTLMRQGPTLFPATQEKSWEGHDATVRRTASGSEGVCRRRLRDDGRICGRPYRVSDRELLEAAAKGQRRVSV